jgi:hypothetical protein
VIGIAGYVSPVQVESRSVSLAGGYLDRGHPVTERAIVGTSPAGRASGFWGASGRSKVEHRLVLRAFTRGEAGP